MTQLLLRVEAVDLGSTIFDTNDLSTIRGAGVACLELPKRLLIAAQMTGDENLQIVFAGASQAVGVLSTTAGVAAVEERLDRLCRGQFPIPNMEPELMAVLPHLSILGVAVPLDDNNGAYQVARLTALGRLRARQARGPSVDLSLCAPIPGAAVPTRPCAVDGMRPATHKDRKGEDVRPVSASVKARRDLGRALRQKLYRTLLGRQDVPEFADSFADLVDRQVELPPSLSNKIAVVHIDGNAFTAIRETAIAKATSAKAQQEREAAFADTVETARRGLLARVIQAFGRDQVMWLDNQKLRFETLLWGGDEAVFVLPAFKVFDFLTLLAEEFQRPNWTFEGQPLTHGVGVLVCHMKTPIANARALADEIATSAKAIAKAGGSFQDAFSIQVVESIEPPSGDLTGFRQRLYGTGNPAAFGVRGAKTFLDYARLLRELTDPDTGFPKSQVFGLLKASRQPQDTNVSLEEAVRAAVRRSRVDAERTEADIEAMVRGLTSPLLGRAPEAPYAGLIRLSELWDLVRPFDRSVGSDEEAA